MRSPLCLSDSVPGVMFGDSIMILVYWEAPRQGFLPTLVIVVFVCVWGGVVRKPNHGNCVEAIC